LQDGPADVHKLLSENLKNRYRMGVRLLHRIVVRSGASAVAGRRLLIVPIYAAAVLLADGARTEVPDAIAVPGGTVVATFHGEGAQIYECKADASGKLAWQFREPIATLLRDGMTTGRHYAGPNWEASDGSAVTGKMLASVPGSTPSDIPWLKLDVVARRGSGTLSGATAVQRINTHGGVLTGACDKQGSYSSVPYSADYVFLRKGP
jgi:hypothetical protein